LKKCIVAGVLILSPDGKSTLLIRHRKLGVWVYPGGHIEKDENPMECAIREAKEETGADFDLLSSSGVKIKSRVASSMPMPLVIMDEDVPYKKAHHRHFDMIYLGRAKSMRFTANKESTDCRWFTRAEAMKADTFSNIRKIINYGFKVYDNLYK